MWMHLGLVEFRVPFWALCDIIADNKNHTPFLKAVDCFAIDYAREATKCH